MQLEAELEQKKEEARYVDASGEKVHSHFNGGRQCCVLSSLERGNEFILLLNENLLKKTFV